jgi:hypothetical protein
MWGFDYTGLVKRGGGSFQKSVKRFSLLSMQISARNLQFGQSAGIGRLSAHGSYEMDSAKGADRKPPKGFINGMSKVRAL